MGKVTVGYVEYEGDDTKVIMPLKVTDYIFELAKVDYVSATASYSFYNLEYKDYEKGAQTNYQKKRAVFLEMDASKDGKTTKIGFLLDMSIDDLNALEENIPHDITDHFVEEKGFIQRPDKKNCDDLRFPTKTNTEKDMFKTFPSITVFKKAT